MSKDLDCIKNHYNKVVNKSIEEREHTKNIVIRKMHNFVKNCLISKYILRNYRVLDIGIGKGGDFQKYKACNISELYGIDIANKSIVDAIKRFREGEYRFKTTLKTRNGYSELFSLHKIFDVISIQFSFHYAFSSEKSLDIAIQNIYSHLKYDGYLIATIPSKEEIMKRKRSGKLSNSLYKIEFINSNETSIYGNSYYYSLVDSVDRCIEYLIDIKALEQKFYEKGLVIVENISFPDFVNKESSYNARFQYIPSGIKMSSDEFEVFSLHSVLVVKKQK